MTRSSALELKSRLELQQSRKLCPLLAGYCTPNCVCYSPPELIDEDSSEEISDMTNEEIAVCDNAERWEVIEPYCGCYFLFGRRL